MQTENLGCEELVGTLHFKGSVSYLRNSFLVL